MANEMQGMFGQDPALVQQALRQQQDAGIAQQAQMDPWSAVAYGAGTGASRLAGGIGGMLGYEDPQVKQANTIKRVQDESMAEAKAMGIDPAKDMEKFGEIVSNKYNMYGMPDKAFGVQQLIQGMKAQQAEIGLKQAKTMAELKKAQTESSPFGKIDVSKFTPESLKIYMQSGDPSTLQLNPASQSAYNTVVQTDKGLYSFDTRTKEFTPLMVSGGKQAIGAQYSPPLQKSLAESKETGKETGKLTVEQGQQNKQMALTINELSRAIRPGGLIDQSTGSGMGAMADKVAGFFGGSPEGAVAIGKLAPISDMVLKMVPRFEGPQSDKDTQSYKEAAGRLADPTVPNEIKKAAAKEILRIYETRKNQFVGIDNEPTTKQPSRTSKAIPLDDYLTSQGF